MLLQIKYLSGKVPGAECWQLCMEQLADNYEPSYGGFSLAPKFPQPGNFLFIFHAFARDPRDKKATKLKDMALHTLKMMARGGIHDHIAQVVSCLLGAECIDGNNYMASVTSMQVWRAS